MSRDSHPGTRIAGAQARPDGQAEAPTGSAAQERATGEGAAPPAAAGVDDAGGDAGGPAEGLRGVKRNAKGYQESWTGYKLHIDAIDGGIPVSCLLTSASVHDSQAAIPLARLTASRVDSLYDLMDSAYDAPEIRAFSQKLGHVPIIDLNPRRAAAVESRAEAGGAGAALYRSGVSRGKAWPRHAVPPRRPFLKGSRGLPLARVYVKHKQILLLIKNILSRGCLLKGNPGSKRLDGLWKGCPGPRSIAPG